MAAGETKHSAVAKGIAYLQRTQGQDGFGLRTATRQRVSAGVLPAISWLFEIFSVVGAGALSQSVGGGVTPCSGCKGQGLKHDCNRSAPRRCRLLLSRDWHLRRALPRALALSPSVAALRRIAERLADVVAPRLPRGIVSSAELPGALAPHVKPGVVHRRAFGRYGYGTPSRAPEWSQRLPAAYPGRAYTRTSHIHTVAISTAGHKQDLARTTGAAIVDMESGLAARVAAENELPFAALRVVADPHDRALPPAAQILLRHDGTPN